jgi:hypothetical protein
VSLGKLEQVRKWMEMVYNEGKNFFQGKVESKKDLLHEKVENQNQFEGFEFFNFLILFFLGFFLWGLFYFPSQGNDISIG